MSTNLPTQKDPPRDVASTRYNAAFIQSVDDQIQALSAEIVRLRNQTHANVFVTADPGGATIPGGYAVALKVGTAGVVMVPATLAAINAGAFVFGVLTQATPPGQNGNVAVGGILPPSIAALTGTGAYVRANASTGALERVASLGPADIAIGHARADGSLVVSADPQTFRKVNGGFRIDVVADFGADPTGVADSLANIQAAHAAARNVRYPAGTFLVAESGTLGAVGQTHHFERTATLKVAAGQTLTIDGAIDAAHDQQVIDLSASGAALVLTRASASRFRAEWVGIVGDDSTDNTTALQALINAMPATGGMIVFGPGRYRFSSTLDISSHTNLTFEGEGARFMQDFDNSPTALIYTGTANPAIHVHTNFARNFQAKEMEITYTNASFAGDLIRIGGDGLDGCPGCSFHHCELGGTPTAFGANSVVSVSSSEQLIVDECLIMFAQRGVYSPASTGINSGLICDKSQFSNFTRAQIELLSGTMLGPKIHRCLLDNTTIINPPYGLLIGATDFSICDNVIAGGTADKTPSGYCVDLTGTGRFTGNMILTDKPGVVVRFGSGSVVVEGNTGYGAPPFRIEGGCVTGGGNTWYPGGLSANASTTGALADAYTYNNGTAGVGATLTRTGNGAFPTLDGVAPSVGLRVLIKDEAGGNAPYNGLYSITQVGDGSHPWILTRVLDADTAAELSNAVVLVFAGGATNAGKAFQCGTVATIGTSAATFTQYNQIAVDIATTTADCALDLGPDSTFSQVGSSYTGYSYKVEPDGGTYKTCGKIKYHPAFDQSTLGPQALKQTVVLENLKLHSAYGTSVDGGVALPAGNVGAGSATLCAVTTIPGHAIDRQGKGVRFRLWGTTSADAHLKQVQVYFAGAALLIDTGAAAANAKPWVLEGEIFRTTDSMHQSVLVWGNWAGAQITPVMSQLSAYDLNSDNTITVFLTGGTANNDVVLHAFEVEPIQ